MLRRLRSGGVLAVLAGVLSFGLAFLGLTLLSAPREVAVVEPTLQPTLVAGVTAQRLAPGHVAMGLVVPADQTLLLQTQPGDRVDVLAVVSNSARPGAVAAVIVSGATILEAPSAVQSALLLQLTPADAQALAHLSGLGLPLSYALWAERGRPATALPVDARAALASLGLTVVAPTPSPNPTTTPVPVALQEPTLLPATPVATQTAQPTPAVLNSDDATAAPRPLVYTVRPGDTMASIAAQFNLDLTALVWANRHVANPDLLESGTQIYLPDYRGRIYVVRSGDTWDGLGRTLGYPPDSLQEINELPVTAPLEAGMELFLPSAL